MCGTTGAAGADDYLTDDPGQTGYPESERAMEARAKARYVRVTPRKARRVVDLIRGLPADQATADGNSVAVVIASSPSGRP